MKDTLSALDVDLLHALAIALTAEITVYSVFKCDDSPGSLESLRCATGLRERLQKQALSSGLIVLADVKPA